MGEHEKGKHRKKKGPEEPKEGKILRNTDNPKTCAHLSHVKDPEPKGGYNRYCPSCDTRWWTSS